MRKGRHSISTNQITNIMNKILRDPVNITLKYLYPKLFRIDNIQEEQMNYYKLHPDNLIVKLKIKFINLFF